MKAFIFNSGSGSRMGTLTKDTPKALVRLTTGETILERQLRQLRDLGIKDVVITTGPFSKKIEEVCRKNYPTLNFTFISNPLYAETNSIYSMLLAENAFDDDFLIMHGDLVFDNKILTAIINHPAFDVALINSVITKPLKDFKGRVDYAGNLEKIAVDIFNENDYALQPLYKMSQSTIKKWFVEINKMVGQGDVNVYAENALNQILSKLKVACLDYRDYYIDEVDNEEDLSRVSYLIKESDYANQLIIESNDYLAEINIYLKKHNLKRPFVMHTSHILKNDEFTEFLKETKAVTFTGYSPNPKYEEVLVGLNIFKKSDCDVIVAIGGGSCIDVAKAIKLFSGLDPDKHYLKQHHQYIDLKLIAVPTTAGTGTESTRYSVIYFEGEKQSLVNDSLVPDFTILSNNFLIKLPIYHKKATLLDALCQAIEAFWCVNSTNLAKKYAEDAISLILTNYQKYINNDQKSNLAIMRASNKAGRAINITQTTAPHAMSYKITSLTGAAHGHAVSMCLPHVYDYMINNIQQVSDVRGLEYVSLMFDELAAVFKVKAKNLTQKLNEIFNDFGLDIPSITLSDIEILTSSVNPTRLKNNPIRIDGKGIRDIYLKVFNL